jgi:hypothetical protein
MEVKSRYPRGVSLSIETDSDGSWRAGGRKAQLLRRSADLSCEMNGPANASQDARSDGLLAILRREPERSMSVLKLGFAGLLIIALWSSLAPLGLSIVIVLPVLAVLLAIYGLTMVMLAVNLVRSVDLNQIEAAMHARRMMTTTTTTTRHVEVQENDAPVFYNWYFSLYLEEEVKRHRRIGVSLAVVVLHVAPHQSDPSRAERQQIDLEVVQLAVNHKDKLIIPNEIDLLEYAFVLPGMDSVAAKDFVSRLVSALGSYWCHYGVAVYPEDASSGEALLEHARELCNGSLSEAVA